LKPADPKKKLDTNQEITIGMVEVFWKNYFGDAGSL